MVPKFTNYRVQSDESQIKIDENVDISKKERKPVFFVMAVTT